MAQTVGFSILGALILSLTYVPMVSALFLSKKISTKTTFADKIINTLLRIYEPVIQWVIPAKTSITGTRHSLILGIISMIFVGSLLIFRNLGGEFIPELNEGDFAVETLLPVNASLSESIKKNDLAQKILLEKFPDEIKQIVSRIGASEIPTDPMGINSCDLIIALKEPEFWKKAENMEELSGKMDEVLAEIPGISFEFTQPIQMRFNELIAGVKSDVAIKIFGEDLEVLLQKANEISRKINTIKGIADLKVEQLDAVPQIAQYGLKISDLNRYLKMAFAGETAGRIFEGEKQFDMVIRLDSSFRQNIQQLKEIYLNLPNGSKIPMSEVAEISYQDAPSQISRENTHRRISIGINVRDRDVESLVSEIQSVIEQKVDLPVGYYVTYGGAFENLQAAKNRLSIAVPVALLLILLLLYFTFSSITEALMVFVTIPLSAIGGVWSLWLRDMPFSVSAGIGFIALFGVAVLNGIVLISTFNMLEKEGMINLRERILAGVKTRFRPVIMTAAVASLGFLPMALSHSPGAEVQRPLATVVIGGLVTATLLTLVILPVVYYLVSKRK
jgi:heavy metal efflux system protein